MIGGGHQSHRRSLVTWPLQAGKRHSRLLGRFVAAVNTGHSADDDPDDSSTTDTGRWRSFQTIGSRTTGPVPNLLVLLTHRRLEIMIK